MSNINDSRGVTPLKLKEFSDGLKQQIDERFATKEELNNQELINKDILDKISEDTNGNPLYDSKKLITESDLITEEPYMMVKSNGIIYLFACGYPMIVDNNEGNKYDKEKDEDSVVFTYKFKDNYKMIVLSKSEAEKTIVFGGYGNELKLNKVLPQTSIVARNVTLRGISGGHFFEGIVGKANIEVTNCTVNNIIGGGWCGETVNGLSSEKNTVMESNVKLTDVIVIECVYGGSQGYGVVDKSIVEINGNTEIRWLTNGGSNGYTREGNVIINNGTINVVQGVNRGVVDTANITLNDGNVENFYVGGEVGDDTVTGKLYYGNLILNGGTINNFYKGNSDLIEFENISGTITDTIVSNGDISMLTKIERPGISENISIDDKNISSNTTFSSKKITDEFSTKEEIGNLSNDIREEMDKLYNHENQSVLDLLSTDGKDLFFNGKNVQKIDLGDGKYAYTTTFMNVTNDTIYTIDVSDRSGLCDQILQVWEFKEGDTDITSVLKKFNNANVDNFYYNMKDVDFTKDTCKIKDNFEIHSTLNEDNLYETEIIDKDEYIDFKSISDTNCIYDDLLSGFSEKWDLTKLNGATITTNSTGTAISPTAYWGDTDTNVAYLKFNDKKSFNFEIKFTTNNLSNSLCGLNYHFLCDTDEIFTLSISDGQGANNSMNSIGIRYKDNNKTITNIPLTENHVRILVTESNFLFYFNGSLKHTIAREDNLVCNNIKLSSYRYSGYSTTLFYVKDFVLEDFYYIKKDNEYFNINKMNYDSTSKVFKPITIDKDNLQDYYVSLKEFNSVINIEGESFKPIDKFNNFQLVSPNQSTLTTYGLKKDKCLVVAKETFSTKLAKNIDYFELVSILSDNSSIKMVLSNDNGITWKTYYNANNEFIDLENTCPLKEYSILTNDELNQWNSFKEEIYSKGIDSVTLKTLDFNSIRTDNMMFAYVLCRESYEDTCEMNKLKYQFDANGSYFLLGSEDVDVKQNSEIISISPKKEMELMKINMGSSGDITIIEGDSKEIIYATEEDIQSLFD